MPITEPEHWKKRLNELEKAALKAGRKPAKIKVIAVTKKFDLGLIRKAWDYGFRHFGENRVSEAINKKHELRRTELKKANWHMIGHLQSKKARKVVGEFVLIHSVDRSSLIQELSKRVRMMGETQPILLQVNVSGEKSKYGAAPDQAPALVKDILKSGPLDLQGLMTMAPWTDDEKILRGTFAACRRLRDELEERFDIQLPELSMGMTNDFSQAMQEGATILRLGRFLFGERP